MSSPFFIIISVYYKYNFRNEFERNLRNDLCNKSLEIEVIRFHKNNNLFSRRKAAETEGA